MTDTDFMQRAIELAKAMEMIEAEGRGILIYMRQIG